MDQENDVYYTLSEPSEAKYTEKMSKFLSFAFHVESPAEARDKIAEIANRYHDARHVCWAYMVGPDRQECLSSDNGEPSGTAGKPIMGQINSFGLTDVVICVVRYFGGIKLGTSGLIAAYREAAREALSLAREEGHIRECHVMDEISFTFPYLSMNDVMKLTKQNGIRTVDQQFDNTCSMTVAIRRSGAQALRNRLGDIPGVSIL